VSKDLIAVISDVHGNRWALEAVLADIERRDIRHIVNLGDCLYGPLDPGGTAEILVELAIPTVRGNEDRVLLDPLMEVSPMAGFVRESLEPDHLEWLGGLPLTLVVHEDLFLCHGTPKRDNEYLLREVLESGVVPRQPDDVSDLVGSVNERVVLCGHDHLPGTLDLPDGRLIVDPGSVGWPAFADDTPFPHVIEAARPHARYGVLSRSDGGWRGDLIALTYDWETAAQTAERNGRPDWAAWLRTGKVKG